MLKSMITLISSRAERAAAVEADRSALDIVDHDLRRARKALQASRRALGHSMAQAKAEQQRKDAAASAATDLEERALSALAAGREDLAVQASEAIAALIAERRAAAEAIAALDAGATELRRTIVATMARIGAIDRERRMAEAAGAGLSARLAAAELTARDGPVPAAQSLLERLRIRQDAAALSLDLGSGTDPGDAAAQSRDALAEAGFGPACPDTPQAVLARLKARLSSAAAPPAPLTQIEGHQP